MANAEILIPQLIKEEGGYVNDKNDRGGETMKGFTWKTWCLVFDAETTHDRFLEMSDEDWTYLFKKLFWNQILGDDIHSQRIAMMVCDWVFNSGKYYPEYDVQDILVHAFGAHIAEDGDFGQATINAINAADEQALFDSIVAKRLWFYDQCIAKNPTDIKYRVGWKNRLFSLVEFCNKHK